jgi:hypothetical protein
VPAVSEVAAPDETAAPDEMGAVDEADAVVFRDVDAGESGGSSDLAAEGSEETPIFTEAMTTAEDVEETPVFKEAVATDDGGDEAVTTTAAAPADVPVVFSDQADQSGSSA